MLCPHHLLKELFRRGNIAFSRKHELDCITLLINRAVQVLTGLPDFDVGLIHSIRGAVHLQIWSDALVNFWSISLDSTKHS